MQVAGRDIGGGDGRGQISPGWICKIGCSLHAIHEIAGGGPSDDRAGVNQIDGLNHGQWPARQGDCKIIHRPGLVIE